MHIESAKRNRKEEYRKYDQQRTNTPERKAYRKTYNHNYRQQNPQVIKQARKMYRERNKKKIAAYHRLRNHGLTQEQYDNMYLEQLGLCAICHDPFGDETPYVDHDHKTGKIRGLVHRKCNLLLGHANDSIETLRYAIWFLEKHQ